MDLPVPSYGVNFVASHLHWDDVLQQIHARVTFSVSTPFGSKRTSVEFSAGDILTLANEVLAWAGNVGQKASIPLQNGFAPDQMTYTPANTGALTIIPQTADQSQVGDVVEEYVYITTPPQNP